MFYATIVYIMPQLYNSLHGNGSMRFILSFFLIFIFACTAAHSSKTNRKHHRVAIDQLDSFLDLIDNAIDVMNNTTVEIEKSQEKLYELYDFCGEVPFDESCDY